MTTPRLAIKDLTKSFFGVQVLRDVSFEVFPGEVLGFVGENGSGKSTTMNIVSGVLQRDSGSIFLDGAPFAPKSRHGADAAGVAFIQQELSIFPNLTVAENLFLGRFPRLSRALPFISRRKLHQRAKELLRSVNLDIPPDTEASALSAGEKQLVEIARGLSTDARLIILDEPTTSLTQREADGLFEIIRRVQARGVSIIYISHALEDVLNLSDRIVVMRDGSVTLNTLSGGITSNTLVTAMVGRSIEALFPERPSQSAPGNSIPILDVEDVGESGKVEDIHLQVRTGEIVGLAGLMGSGRSEFARIIFGLDPHRRGIIRFDGQQLSSGDLRARISGGAAFLTEDRRNEGLMMEATVAENMALAALPLFATGFGRRINSAKLADATQASANQLNLKSGNIRSTEVRTLSGGNQQKVVLARWLLRQPRLFILDEPTRGVDVGAKEEIYRVLTQMAAKGMAILIISSEIEELIGLSDRILVMHRGRIQAQFRRAEFDRETLLKAVFGQEAAA